MEASSSPPPQQQQQQQPIRVLRGWITTAAAAVTNKVLPGSGHRDDGASKQVAPMGKATTVDSNNIDINNNNNNYYRHHPVVEDESRTMPPDGDSAVSTSTTAILSSPSSSLQEEQGVGVETQGIASIVQDEHHHHDHQDDSGEDVMNSDITSSVGSIMPPPMDGFDVPDGQGLVIALSSSKWDGPDAAISHPSSHAIMVQQPESNEQNNINDQDPSHVLIYTTPDNRYTREVHPNCYAPAGMQDVCLLHGGGSGAAVFHGLWHVPMNNSAQPVVMDMVMKHAGAKDCREVFSLVTIRQELMKRQKQQQQQQPDTTTTTLSSDPQQQLTEDDNSNNNNCSANMEIRRLAAERMQSCLPEFVLIYISPHHVRDRGVELWQTVRMSSAFSSLRTHLSPQQKQQNITNLQALQAPQSNRSRNRLLGKYLWNDKQQDVAATPNNSASTFGSASNDDPHRSQRRLSPAPHVEPTSPAHGKRNLHVRCSDTDDVEIDVDMKNVTFYLPGLNRAMRTASGITVLSGGTALLQDFAKEWDSLLEEHGWKVTIAQKTIGAGGGGDDGSEQQGTTGATVLTQGKFRDQALLQHLLDEYTRIIQDLRCLTSPEEVHGITLSSTNDNNKSLSRLEQVRQEATSISEQHKDVTTISKMLDTFVGSALKKNYDPIKGRFPHLRTFGVLCRQLLFVPTASNHAVVPATYKEPTRDDQQNTEDNDEETDENLGDSSYTFMPQEEFPAMFLGMILEQGADLKNVFVEPPSHHCALDAVEHTWLDLLQHAVFISHASGTDCIWTCGLTDAGLHNTFFSSHRGLELFDLGAPNVMPQPAFLTKFLMSIFHCFGMEEDNHNQGSWFHRFYIADDMLALMPETKQAIPYACHVFECAIQHFVHALFDDDVAVGQLLIRYTTLQLLSDAAFCLQRWEAKGGGSPRSPTSTSLLEKWMWRALWDLYIASLVYDKYIQSSSSSS